MSPNCDTSASPAQLLALAKSLPVTHTPIQYSSFLSKHLGVKVWIKREDLQDHVGSGVKRRAIAATLAHQAATGRGPIVIDGVPQSNCVMAMAHYCQKAGVPLCVILRGLPSQYPEGNYREILASGARIIQLSDPAHFEAIREAIVADLGRAGNKPLMVPAGAAAPFAIPGPIGLGCEIADQELAAGLRFDFVVLPVGTGGTITGLTLSKELHGAEWSIIGVRIDDYPWSAYEERFRASSMVFDQEISPLTALPPPDVTQSDIPFALYDHALGGGYGRFTDLDIVEAEQLFSSTGLYFGPTYMLKAVRGLKEMVAAGRISSSSSVLLIHTGGTNERKALKAATRSVA